ncbi:MAG TPA: hypothetical protein VK608_16315 [Edaphobacter sp.]|nr:hypothetical protein [Edaphobacter sp.]
MFKLPEMLDWQRASWIGELLAMALATPFYVFFFGLVVAAVWMTWPINSVLGIVLLMLAATRGLKSDALKKGDEKSHYVLVLDAIRATLVPMAFGMCGVFWMQLWFNAFDTDSNRVREIENRVAYASATAHDWVSFSIKGSVGLAVGLIVLIVWGPQLQTATRLLSLKSWISKVAACLVCVSGFTCFSQVPFKYQDWKELKRIQAETRTENPESKKIALAEAYLIVKNMSDSDANHYRYMFREVNDTVPYSDRGPLIEAIVKKQIATTADGHKRRLEIATVPDNLFSKSEGGRKDQALEVIQKLFTTLIGAATPEIHGLAGKFIEELVDQESERFFDQRIRPKLDEGLEQLALTAAKERLAEMETQNEDRADGSPQRSEIEIIRDELATARQEVDRADREHQEQYRAKHPMRDEMRSGKF